MTIPTTAQPPTDAHPHKRVLLVEDDPLVGAVLAEMLEDADYEVDGPHRTLSDGVAALADHFPDCAVLDVKLDRQTVGLLADDLDLYDIPYVLCSGLPPQGSMAARAGDHPFVPKDQAYRRLLPALRAITTPQ
ncbi:hypothetical protein LWE61_15860 [Sphingobium sufflavum]|uniref:response regulator n=1 Tax=Sphingobium sufflavum TaxID=1129547 RepID=UPI001F3915BF|nr:response regulator [Sphingobium sufflavum]MCE7798024.1 hypothetical protein [Sphingobium sufflavum]